MVLAAMVLVSPALGARRRDGGGSTPLQLMQDERIAFRIENHRHAADRRFNLLRLDGHVRGLQPRGERVEIVHLQRDAATRAIDGFEDVKTVSRSRPG
jgi:hypothetical protein